MKKSVETIINVVFWLLIVSLLSWLFNSIFSYNNIQEYVLNGVVGNLLFLPGLAFSYYIFYIFLIPLIQKKKIFKGVVLMFTSSVFAATIIILILMQIRIMGINMMGMNIKVIIQFSILTFIMGIIGVAIKGSILWVSSISEKKALEKKHSESKTALLLLKAQLNPHFLFNSLNNIDILIEENPKTASEYLKKLSDILRYVLYETKEDKTDLAKEIAQIKSYVELQKIRTANQRYVNFNVNGEIAEQQIAPMIFLPFIENAFKHSKNKTIDNAIDISFEVSNGSVKMVCKNYYEAGQLEVVKNEGLGIETIEQRLNLLYPEKHKLAIDKTENWFNVTLSIEW
jgi:sensor histidine kinase YesM